MADWHKKVYRPKIERGNFSIKSWQTLCDKVIKRDKEKCKACGTTNNLTVHHIIPRVKGGKDIMKNLETLCQKCHDKVECGEDIFVVEEFKEGQDWHEWVYGGCRKPHIAY